MMAEGAEGTEPTHLFTAFLEGHVGLERLLAWVEHGEPMPPPHAHASTSAFALSLLNHVRHSATQVLHPSKPAVPKQQASTKRTTPRLTPSRSPSSSSSSSPFQIDDTSFPPLSSPHTTEKPPRTQRIHPTPVMIKRGRQRERPPLHPPDPPHDEQLKRMARAHSTLVLRRLVPNLMTELRLLFQLLTVSPRASSHPVDTLRTSDPLLRTPLDCVYYAAAVLERLGCLLQHLGSRVVGLLVENEALSTFAPDLVKFLLDTCERLEDTAKKGEAFWTPTPTVLQSESRNDYSTAQEKEVYNNREKCRLEFVNALKDAQKPEWRFRWEMTTLLGRLHPSNMVWFAQLFVELLLQVSLSGEAWDPAVQTFAKDPEKLRRLQQRLVSSSRNRRTEGTPIRTAGGRDSSGPLGAPLGSFPAMQEVFFLFIEAGDSHRFNTALISVLMDRIADLSSVGNVDVSRVFKHVPELKVLAKFLGLLLFSPNWSSVHNKLNALHHEIEAYASMKDRIGPVFDVLKYIEEASAHEALILAIPWVVEFMKMIHTDHASRATVYYQSVLNTLKHIYASECLLPTSNAFNMFRLCLVVELEALFNALGMDPHATQPEGELPFLLERHDQGGISSVDSLLVDLDQRFLLSVLPDLDEIRLLLLEGSQRRRTEEPTVTIKKITPVPPNVSTHSFQALVDSQAHVSALEGSFFDQHPDLKNLVEFVVQIVVRNVGDLAMKQCDVSYVDRIVESASRGNSTTNLPSCDLELCKVVAAQEVEAALMEHALDVARTICPAKLRECLNVLVADHEDRAVLDTCVQVAVRHAQPLIRDEISKKVKKKVLTEVNKSLDEQMKLHQQMIHLVKESPEPEKSLPLPMSPGSRRLNRSGRDPLGMFQCFMTKGFLPHSAHPELQAGMRSWLERSKSFLHGLDVPPPPGLIVCILRAAVACSAPELQGVLKDVEDVVCRVGALVQGAITTPSEQPDNEGVDITQLTGQILACCCVLFRLLPSASVLAPRILLSDLQPTGHATPCVPVFLALMRLGLVAHHDVEQAWCSFVQQSSPPPADTVQAILLLVQAYHTQRSLYGTIYHGLNFTRLLATLRTARFLSCEDSDQVNKVLADVTTAYATMPS